MALLVPPPILKQDSTTGPKFGFNKPIELTCTGITFPDGRPLIFDNALASGFLLYRETGQGVVTAWHEQEPRSWVAAIPGPDPQPLLYHEDVWKSVLVAIGEKDAQDVDKFELPPSNQPQPGFYVRCFFAGKDVHGERHEGASPPSNVIQLDSAAASTGELAGIEITPPDLKKAEKVRIFLTHNTLVETAELRLERNPAGVTATLAVEGNSLMIDSAGVHVHGPLDHDGFVFP